MIQKKICMLGTLAVGKTSLVRRFVQSLFGENYQTTIGVKVDKKMVTLEGREVQLMLWDLAGEDRFNGLQTTCVRGSAGLIFVADGTRPDTLAQFMNLSEKVLRATGDVPCVLAPNKIDLANEWRLTEADVVACNTRGWDCPARQRQDRPGCRRAVPASGTPICLAVRAGRSA